MSKSEADLKKKMTEYKKTVEDLKRSFREDEKVFSRSPIAGFPAIRRMLEQGGGRK